MQINFNNLELRDTGTKGKGVFSKVTFPAHTTIFEITGNLIYKKDIPRPFPLESNNYFQIGKDYYLGLSGSFDDYLNHSCNPNCYIYIGGTRAFLITLYQINPGTEITFDYSTTCNETLEEWKLDCNCGSFNCRKVISGFQYLDDNLKQKYIKMGIVPGYLLGNKI